MSNPLLALMAATNAGVAIGYLRAGQYGMTLVFTSYAVACLGFIWSNWRS